MSRARFGCAARLSRTALPQLRNLKSLELAGYIVDWRDLCELPARLTTLKLDGCAGVPATWRVDAMASDLLVR